MCGVLHTPSLYLTLNSLPTGHSAAMFKNDQSRFRVCSEAYLGSGRNLYLTVYMNN
jgi:hypothetical protein